MSVRERSIPVLVLSLLLVASLSVPASALTRGTNVPDELQSKLESSVAKWIGEQGKGTENSHGKKTKRGYFSRDFRSVEDGYNVTAHLETAKADTKVTERFLLTLKPEGNDWSVVEEKLEDTFEGMHRESGASCHAFSKMSFEREGMTLAATNGTLCASYYQGGIAEFAVHADDASYEFEPPEHAMALHLLPDFHAIDDRVKKDHTSELIFKPAAFLFECDPQSCDELIATHFEGLEPLDRDAAGFGVSDTPSGKWAAPLFAQLDKERAENAFVHFREPYRAGNRYWSVFIPRELDPFTYPGFEAGLFDFSGSLPGRGVQLKYNNWGGFEVEFNVWPRRVDDPEAIFGTLFGYYSEDTLANNDPYQIERRDDTPARWHQVYKIDGEVDLGVEDPEMLAADITFGIELKQAMRRLPFFIQSIPRRDFTGKNEPRELYVNSVQLDGQELTWTRTSQLGGVVILPEQMPAGTKVELRMNFKTRAMKKWNFSFTEVSRFGWMPFVRFADFVDEFELTVNAPADFKVLGIGHKVSEEKKGDVVTTHWKADSPVVFPSITLGRYEEDTAGKKFAPAEKADGTPIPVVVHVDKASFNQWNIPPGNLRPIAQQAVNSINLYREISGIDYPYGELNFVNDPQGFLYGQAPSSLIYLGSGVFRGEGFLASVLQGANSTYIAKFLRSVVAHEVGHQWWGSRVSNANQRNYWFVESLAEYFSALYLEGMFGPKEYDEQVEEWRRTVLDRDLKASVQNASVLWAGEGGFGPYQAAVYNKGPFAFHMLREIFGDEKFFAFLKEFSQELAGKREIVSLDIQNAAETALGGVGPDGERYKADLGWFFDQWLRGSGLPQFRFEYDVRATEDGGYIIDGVIEQRVVVGSKRRTEVLEGTYYRGIVDITVKTKKDEFQKRVIVDGKATPFQLKVAAKPLDVALNENNQMLAHDVLENQDW